MDGSIGAPITRRDAVAKATGAARYAADFPEAGIAYAALTTSQVSRGRITRLDTGAAEAVPGVQMVMTHRSLNQKLEQDGFVMGGGHSQSSVNPLGSDEVRYAGQIVAITVADTVEAAEEGAHRVRAEYAAEPAKASIEDPELEAKPFGGGKAAIDVGDADAALAGAPVKVEAEYATPAQHHNPIELYATIAAWRDNKLEVHAPSQWVIGQRAGLAAVFGIPVEDVRVISPYIGGGFGGKATLLPHTYLIAAAARRLGRPVKLVVPREQMFTVGSFRPATRQKVALAAERDGRLLAYRHEVTGQTSRMDDIAFPGTQVAASMYACPNIRTRELTVATDVNTPGFMRAPAETPAFFAFESAMDELAVALGMDPVELRIRNEPDRDPVKGVPYSSRSLVQCYRRGAEIFGWSRRDPTPGSMRDADGALLGWGCATATYPVFAMPAAARVRITPDGRARVFTAAHDLGTGAYTVLAQIAADALGLRVEDVRVELGDSDLPASPVAGGSVTTASVGSAVHTACLDARNRLLEAATAEGGPLAGQDPRFLRVEGGQVIGRDGASRPVAEAAGNAQGGTIEVVSSWGPNGLDPATVRAGLAGAMAQVGPVTETHAMFSFGAQFAEVRIDPVTRRPRASRLVGVFACGRIINPRTARSNLMGGMIWGASHALLEETAVDRRRARFANTDLGTYHFSTSADVRDVVAEVVDERDTVVNPIGVKGVGELGIVGMNAAVANAVFHATGTRVRRTPIVVDELLGAGTA